MSEKRYYVRVRGKVMGPFATSQLQSLRDRGQFRSFHEVSEDRQNWGNAARLPGMFSSDASQFDGDDADDRPVKPAPEPPADAWFYVDSSGRQSGPVGFGALQMMRNNGSLNNESMIWKEGWPEWRQIASVMPAPVQKGNESPSLNILDSLPLFLSDPVGGLPRLCEGLRPQASFGLGIFFYALAILGVFIGALIHDEFRGVAFFRDIIPRALSRFEVASRLFAVASLPLLSWTVAIAVIRLISRGRGTIGTDTLTAGAVSLPFGLLFPVIVLFGRNFEVVLFLYVFAGMLQILILYSAVTRWVQLPDRGAIFAVPATVLFSMWLFKVIAVALLENDAVDPFRVFKILLVN